MLRIHDGSAVKRRDDAPPSRVNQEAVTFLVDDEFHAPILRLGRGNGRRLGVY
jgi:hypothetical protein